MNSIERRVRAARFPVALTGAGISAPSGIPTFEGTWKGRPIRDFLSRDYFNAHPEGFFELYMDMVSWCRKPVNAAHRKLVEWDLPVITQNIDGLHTRAGSRRVIEMHGTLSQVVCRRCGRRMAAEAFVERIRPAFASGDSKAMRQAIRCDCGKIFDTDVVLYGDSVHGVEEAWALAEQCDLMLVVGTSLTTYPAAMLPEVAARHGAEIILANDDCIAQLTGDDE